MYHPIASELSLFLWRCRHHKSAKTHTSLLDAATVAFDIAHARASTVNKIKKTNKIDEPSMELLFRVGEVPWHKRSARKKRFDTS